MIKKEKNIIEKKVKNITLKNLHKIIAILSVCIILSIILILLYICNSVQKRGTIISGVETITFNKDEKEILLILRDLNQSLLNPVEKTENTWDMMPSKSIALRDFVLNIEEARKKVLEDSGTIAYLFKVDIEYNNGILKNKTLVIKDSRIILIDLTEDELNLEEKNEVKQNNDGSYSITFGKEAYIDLFNSINDSINDLWNNAESYTNINYDKILKKI